MVAREMAAPATGGRKRRTTIARCEICNRPLTDPISIRMRVGPECRANRGIEIPKELIAQIGHDTVRKLEKIAETFRRDEWRLPNRILVSDHPYVAADGSQQTCLVELFRREGKRPTLMISERSAHRDVSVGAKIEEIAVEVGLIHLRDQFLAAPHFGMFPVPLILSYLPKLDANRTYRLVSFDRYLDAYEDLAPTAIGPRFRNIDRSKVMHLIDARSGRTGQSA